MERTIVMVRMYKHVELSPVVNRAWYTDVADVLFRYRNMTLMAQVNLSTNVFSDCIL
jgi:hypothetical protein